jgi:hypothetical protein
MIVTRTLPMNSFFHIFPYQSSWLPQSASNHFLEMPSLLVVSAVAQKKPTGLPQMAIEDSK